MYNNLTIDNDKPNRANRLNCSIKYMLFETRIIFIVTNE